MNKESVEQIIKKVLYRDYERWVVYADACINERSAYTKSFFCWKHEQGFLKEDIDILVELLSD